MVIKEQNIKYLKPLRIGESIHLESEVISKNEDNDTITVMSKAYNERKDVIVTNEIIYVPIKFME